MTESSEDKKERNTLDELQKIGPIILNCHRSERQRQSRAALELKAFCKFLANSYADGRKGASEMEDALRYVHIKGNNRGGFSSHLCYLRRSSLSFFILLKLALYLNI